MGLFVFHYCHWGRYKSIGSSHQRWANSRTLNLNQLNSDLKLTVSHPVMEEGLGKYIHHQIRISGFIYQTGDSVYYQQENKWKGQGKVVRQDGKKIVFVTVKYGWIYQCLNIWHYSKWDKDSNSKTAKFKNFKN